MPNTYNPDRLRKAAWDVKWGAYDFGMVNKVTPNLSLRTVPKKAGSLGGVTIGEWIVELTGNIVVEHREIDAAMLQKLMPWFTSGNIAHLPATWNKDLYDYAAKLVLHPNDLPAATVTQDVTLLKAVPTFQHVERDGETPEVLVSTWRFFPDRAQLATSGSTILAYGFVGDA